MQTATKSKILTFMFVLEVLLSALYITHLCPVSTSLSTTVARANSSSFLSSALPTIYVNPPTIKAMVGQPFIVNITISDVVDLYGWEFKLGWNSSLLEAVNVTEGDFLKKGGDTFFIKKIYNVDGYVLASAILLGKIPGVNGVGTLANVEFNVKERGESVLELYDTKLGDSQKQPMNHTTIDGYYYTPFGHDVAIKGVTPSKTVVGQGYSLPISVSVKNYGSFAENFNITAYYNETNIIATQDIILTNGNSTTITFTWNTTGITKGNYTISAYATPVPDETDIADNTYTDGFVVVAMVGDVNADGEVDILDVASLAKAYGSYPGHQTWNPNYDLNDDGQIDILDIATTARNYGKLDS